MKKTPYRISAEAISDLEKIWEYTFHRWSPEQAERYYKLIISEIEFLSVNLLAGKPVDYIRKGYMAGLVKSHLIFYRISEDQILEVIRILHHSMDVNEKLIK